jgi:hypothetical protein
MAAARGKVAVNLKTSIENDTPGRHSDPNRTLNFPEDRQWVAYGVNHLELLGSAAVYAHLRQWLT